MCFLISCSDPSKRGALYIHIPFCRLNCTYCAFYKERENPEEIELYVSSLLKELEYFRDKPFINQSNIEAVFFGGGTPSLLTPEQITSVMKTIHSVFPLSSHAEITMESSLSDMDDEKMEAAVSAGINRFSFGVQSFNSQVRNHVGRPDPRELVMEKLGHFSKLPILTIIDLIYGLPYQTEDIIRQDILDAFSAGISGLDLYKLQIHPASVLGKEFKRTHKVQDIRELQHLFQAASSVLEEKGGEILSCTHWKMKNEERSLYNTIAAEGSDLLPIGVACGGQIGSIRYTKARNLARYGGDIGFLPFMGYKKGPFSHALGYLNSVCDRGIIRLPSLQKELGDTVFTALLPVLQIWEKEKLLVLSADSYYFTSPARFQYRSMARFLLHTMEYILYGKPEETSGSWTGMHNMM